MVAIYMNEDVTWVQDAGSDQWGTPNTPTETAIKAHVRWRTRLFRAQGGGDVLSVGVITVKNKPSHKDKFTFDGVSYPIMAITRIDSFGVVDGYRAELVSGGTP